MTEPEERLLTPDEVRDRCGYALETLRKWRSRGEGPPWVKVRGRCRYPEAEFEQWWEQQKQGVGER